MYHIRIYNVSSNMLILSSVALQKNIIYFKLLAKVLLGIPKLYTAGLLLCLLRIKIKVFLSPSEFESFEGTKFVFMYGKSFKKRRKFICLCLNWNKKQEWLGHCFTV